MLTDASTVVPAALVTLYLKPSVPRYPAAGV